MIAVFDDFIKDENLLKEIADAGDEFFYPTGQYKYWKGWWNNDPKNVKQRLIKYIWKDHLPVNIGGKLDGFEHWTGIQRGDQDGRRNYLELHLDDDVAYREKTGNRIIPVLGCVYYPEGFEFEGGELLIYTDGEGEKPEVIKTRPNRLVIFSPGTVVHGVSEVTSGVRGAIAINAWSIEPWSVSKGHIILE
tara:strand:- start:219 stop:791 length:573 start_codon:yes stop_codon:yes gene_type:complete